MARFSNSLRDLYLAARYDTHFMLWHVVLWILTRFTHNCQSMQWLHLALATGSVWVLIRFGPFTWVQKALYGFGYFAMFEYCLIAREYVWIGLLLFSLCAVCARRVDSFVAQAVILFLLSNINALATIIAFSFVVAAAVEHLRRGDVGELWATRKRALILSGVILCAALLSDALQSIKPKDATLFQRWPLPMTVSSFAAALGNVWRGYVPIPRPFLEQLWGVVPQAWRGYVSIPRPLPHLLGLIWGSNFLLDSATQTSPQPLALGATLSLSLLAISVWTLRRSPIAVVWYLFGTGLMLVFHFVGSEAAVRHDGLYFILYLACLWCGFTWGRNPKPRSSPAILLVQMERFFLPSILAIQVVAGAYAWTLHLLTPFSTGKLTADFIRQHGYANLLIIGTPEMRVTPVTAYLDQPIYYPDSERYGTFWWDRSARHDLSQREVLQSVAQMAMKAHGDTLLVWYGQFTLSQGGITKSLKSAWLSPDGSFYSLLGPPTEQCVKMSLLADFLTTIVDEAYSLYLIGPDYAAAHYNLGLALMQTGKIEEAIAHYQQALLIKPDYAAAHYNLGVALMQTGKIEEAIAHYQQALLIKPDLAEAHVNLGTVLLREGKVSDAIGHYEQALRSKPDYAEAHYNLGVALAQTGKIEEAIAHYQQALLIKPDLAEAHVNLGTVLLREGKVSDAIGHCEQALRSKPDYAEAHNNLGLALMQTGKIEEAIAHFEQALQINPDLAEAHSNLGDALAQVGRVPEAIEHYKQALRIKPDLTQAQNGLARLQAGR
jgi:tetratricopeptide (TPR) repeat protein